MDAQVEGTDALRAIAPDGLGIIVKTTAWQVQIAPEAGFGRQRVVYAADAKGVRLSDGRTVWSAKCRAITPDALPGGDLRRDDARLLKAKLAECAVACAKELWASYSGITTPSGKSE